MKNTSTEPHPLVLLCIVAACVLSVALILAIPAESLAVDLVYQGF